MEYFSSDYHILLPVLNTFTFETEEYCLDVNSKLNDAQGPEKTSINIAVSFDALRLQFIHVETFYGGLPKSD